LASLWHGPFEQSRGEKDTQHAATQRRKGPVWRAGSGEAGSGAGVAGRCRPGSLLAQRRFPSQNPQRRFALLGLRLAPAQSKSSQCRAGFQAPPSCNQQVAAGGDGLTLLSLLHIPAATIPCGAWTRAGHTDIPTSGAVAPGTHGGQGPTGWGVGSRAAIARSAPRMTHADLVSTHFPQINFLFPMQT